MRKQMRILMASLMVFTKGAFFLHTTYAATRQDTVSVSERTLQQLDVVGSGRDRRLSSSTPTLKVDAEKLKLTGTADISDAMRRLPGVYLRDYGGAGGMKTVSLRGLGSQHTGVIYDGIMLSDVQTGQVDISRYNLSDIASITLNSGETDEIFLPARASASSSSLVVNTFSDKDFLNPSLRLDARMCVGAFGQYNPYVRIGKSFSERFVMSATADFISSKNNYPYILGTGSNKETYRRENSQMTAGKGEFGCYWRPTSASSLSAKIYYFGADRHLPGPALYYNPKNNERLKDENTFVQASYRTRLSSVLSLQGNAKFNWSRSYYTDLDEVYPGGLLDRRYFQREYYAAAALLYTPVSGLQLDYSVDWFLNNLNSNQPNDARPYRNSILQMIGAKYKYKWLSITAKALYSIYLNRALDGDGGKDAQRLSPSLGFSFQPMSNRLLFLRASYKNIFRMPTFNELYFDHYGSINLNPEITDQLNAGATWSLQDRGVIEEITVTCDGYLNFVKNKIVAIPYNMFVNRMMNLGKVRVLGLDATLNSTLRIASRQRLILAATYSLQRAAPVTDPAMSDWMKQLAYVPLNSGSGSITWDNPWVTVGVSASGCSSRYTTNENLPGTKLPGYMELNFTLQHTFRFHGHSLELRADLINALDERYELVARYPMPGRSWLASVAFKL